MNTLPVLSTVQTMAVDYYLSKRPGTVRCLHCGQPFRTRHDMFFTLPECEPMHSDCIGSKYMVHNNTVKMNPARADT